MELGVDIAELNVVNLRNVPPTPANYAQPVSYTHLRAHETVLDLVCRLLLEHKKIAHTLLNTSHHCITATIHMYSAQSQHDHT